MLSSPLDLDDSQSEREILKIGLRINDGCARCFINAMTEHSTRVLRENKWYYVWVLANTNTSR